MTHRAADAEQAGDVCGRAIDAGPVILNDKPHYGVILGDRLDLDLGAVVETVIGDLLDDKPRQQPLRDAGALLESFDRPSDQSSR